MNLAQIYSETIETLTPEQEALKAKREVEEQQAQAAVANERAKWLAVPFTKDILAQLEKEALEFDKVARNYAMSYHQHKNSNVIVGALIQSATIRNIIKYARGN